MEIIFIGINAALNTPNLTQLERAMLLHEAFYHAKEGATK